MPGLVPGIHVFLASRAAKSWMAGSSPAMTVERLCRHQKTAAWQPLREGIKYSYRTVDLSSIF
jgi:hypothetical protein